LSEAGRNDKKFCGNCTSHNAYSYPDQVFCTKRFLKKKEAIVQTLWCCEEWHPNTQECRCVRDALEKQKE
jgi:hypothetical protein